jgi:hypothetical protein
LFCEQVLLELHVAEPSDEQALDDRLAEVVHLPAGCAGAHLGYERNQVNQEPTRNQEVLNFFLAGTETYPGSAFFLKPRTET